MRVTLPRKPSKGRTIDFEARVRDRWGSIDAMMAWANETHATLTDLGNEIHMSRSAVNVHMRKRDLEIAPIVKCPNCGKEFRKVPITKQFCCAQCMIDHRLVHGGRIRHRSPKKTQAKCNPRPCLAGERGLIVSPYCTGDRGENYWICDECRRYNMEFQGRTDGEYLYAGNLIGELVYSELGKGI